MNDSIKPKLGDIRLQELTSTHIEKYHAEMTKLAVATKQLHHSVITSALKRAMKEKLVVHNVARDVDGKPRAQRKADDVEQNCWSSDEARSFLTIAKADGPRSAALFSLALDTGMRLGELVGLRWADVNLDTGRVSIKHQLDGHGGRGRGENRARHRRWRSGRRRQAGTSRWTSRPRRCVAA